MLLKQSKNSTMRTRLLLGLGLTCFTLVAVPLTMYMLQNGRTLQSVSLKRVGIAPLKALLRMVQLLQQHRGLSAGVLGGSTTLEAQRAAKQTETAQAVKARWPQLPVILVTGWGDALEGEPLDSRGVDAVLAKPYTVAQLQDALAQCSVGPD